ncbi:HEAT repeat domain-containing protein [Oscillatoria sp. FACHB-1406]|uniref:HEAT repeat domain-containing protein n=1 Tax=Oscillatoria sp. FACHB-1406 TaxID=2692846 RepID=UPI00168A13D7|nr:HEAT repeat domain-containing protein [Oscillatoria sp. FACHB-1406]MBD2577946.1 HEAT repeat domain-containing protein [Oscillatoria sp. FACHB-1406]
MMSYNTVNFSSLEREASSETTPAPRLTELAGQSLELARIVAKNITAPPTLLAELSTSEDRLTRQNVTQNPNTSPEVLCKLGAEFPDDFLDNPVFPLLPLENPNWVEMLPEDTVQAFLSHHRAQQVWLEGCRNHPDLYELFFRWNLEIHDFPTHWLEEFSRSIDEDVREGVAKNPKTPVSCLKQLSQDTSDRVRHGVANHPKTPVSLLKQLLRDTSEAVRRVVANHPNTPPEVLYKLGAEFPDEFLDNPVFPLLSLENPDWVAMLREDIALTFLYHPRAQQAMLESFRNYTHQYWLFVRWQLQVDDDFPTHWLEEFSRSIDEDVREGVAKNPKTPVSLLKQLSQDTSDRVRGSVARNPQTPVSLLEQLSQDTSDRVRKAVAENLKTPVSYLETLATDSSLSVSLTADGKSKGRMGE